MGKLRMDVFRDLWESTRKLETPTIPHWLVSTFQGVRLTHDHGHVWDDDYFVESTSGLVARYTDDDGTEDMLVLPIRHELTESDIELFFLEWSSEFQFREHQIANGVATLFQDTIDLRLDRLVHDVSEAMKQDNDGRLISRYAIDRETEETLKTWIRRNYEMFVAAALSDLDERDLERASSILLRLADDLQTRLDRHDTYGVPVRYGAPDPDYLTVPDDLTIYLGECKQLQSDTVRAANQAWIEDNCPNIAVFSTMGTGPYSGENLYIRQPSEVVVGTGFDADDYACELSKLIEALERSLDYPLICEDTYSSLVMDRWDYLRTDYIGQDISTAIDRGIVQLQDYLVSCNKLDLANLVATCETEDSERLGFDREEWIDEFFSNLIMSNQSVDSAWVGSKEEDTISHQVYARLLTSVGLVHALKRR